MTKYTGQSVRRYEDPRFIQGRGKYVANLTLPNMAYLAIKRSPYAHARILNIDTSAAEALDGVVGVVTKDDMLAEDSPCGPLPCGWQVPDLKVPQNDVFQVDKVRHVGDRVVAVVAESPAIAQDALDLIEVDYEPLPAVVDARKAMDPGAPLVHDDVENNVSYEWVLGDKEVNDQAFADADHVVELELVNQRLIATAMEPRACVAQWNAFSEEMTLWTTSQNPHLTKVVMSAFTFTLPEHKLRVISPDVGGGFGTKIPNYPEEVITPLAAMKFNRPVKWVATRTESAMSDTQGRDHVTKAKLAFNDDGTVTAMNVETWANNGAYLSIVAPLIPTAFYITLLSGLYKIPTIYGKVYGTLTHTVWVDAYRGAGRPEAAYVVERLMDLAAEKLGVNKLEFRKRNLIPPSDFPYETPVAMTYDSGNYQALFAAVEESANYENMLAEQKKARAEGRLVGIGISGCIEASGPAPSAVAGALGGVTGFWESGGIRVHATGKVTVLTGAHAHGQGHETTFRQIVADQLGTSMEDIEIAHGDTAVVANGMGTYGSRSTAVGGSALVRSSEKIIAKMKKIAAHQLEAAEEDLVYDTSSASFHVTGSPDQTMSFGEIAFAAYTAHDLPEDVEPGLEENAYYDPNNFTFPNSAHIAQVEVDRDTGEITIQKYVAVDDVGTIINPMIVEGQIVGGIAQGVGQALWEEAVYDESGQLLTGSLMDYAVPRADGLPSIEVDSIETPSPHNPLGAKGAGEMGTIAATPTISSAVIDALSPLGIQHIDIPLTPEKVWRAIQASSNGGGN
ncbi:MAG: xanthine dehydrogenase family protein molybdopterin-binding subunit [Candidatus Promineifilaceae bacterium]|nr:xanthine dehydrogenase family protein molybdopterin-binding subunit [Candidatus Promineifilaceae bacterium]